MEWGAMMFYWKCESFCLPERKPWSALVAANPYLRSVIAVL